MHLRSLSQDDICKRIKKLRREFRYPDGGRLTQEALSEKLGVDPTFISKLETGKLANLNIDILQGIAAELGLTVNDLCYEKQEEAKTIPFPETGKNLEQDVSEAGDIIRNLTEDQRKMIMNMLRAAV